MEKLSILIPVYNAEKYIGNLLECIIKQMTEGIEVILLDDGSRDSSKSICEEYEQKYPEQLLLISRENKGTVCTRRELLQAATGEWIWMIDSDDMLVDNALSTIQDEISSKEQFDMLMFDYYWKTGGKRTVIHQLSFEDEITFDREHKKELYRRVISSNSLNHLWSKVFRRRCVDFDADYKEYEDVKKANDLLQLLPIVTDAEIIKYKPVPLYIYNTNNQGSLSHAFHFYTYTSLKKVYQRKKEYICKWGMWEELQNEYFVSGTKTAIFLLRFHACSNRTKQEFDAFFETVSSDNAFSEAINKSDSQNFKGMNKIYSRFLKKHRKTPMYAVANLQRKFDNFRKVSR